MIKFFRRIRQQLLTENPSEGRSRAGKYLLYAIGEIVLVVVGILIALQINTWNSERKTQLKEEVILQSLLDEFKTNSASLLKAKERAMRLKEGCLDILKYISDDQLELSKATSDDLIMRNVNFIVTFDVSDRYVNSLLSTGDIYILQNDSLKQLITNWNAVVIDNSGEAEGFLQHHLNTIVTPFLDEHYSSATEQFKAINHYNTPFKSDYRQIYRNPQFENIVIRKVTAYHICIESYDQLDKYINKIISITEQELQFKKITKAQSAMAGLPEKHEV